MNLPAVVLLSGGLDSTTVAYHAVQEGHAVYAITFRYGQRHHAELVAARRVSAMLGVAEHRFTDVDLRAIGGSALTSDSPVPHGRDLTGGGIPTTYVPARNTIFLSFALGWAEVLGAEDIYIGANAVDYSGYPDCRPGFLRAYEAMANLAIAAAVAGRARIRIHAPLLTMTKAQIVDHGCELGVDFSLTHSCYDPDLEGRACGTCDSCQLRLAAFAQVGLDDPIRYKS